LMAEILRKSDARRTGIAQWLRTLVLFAAAGGAVFPAAERPAAERPAAEAEKKLEAAIYREMVLGDLTGAMEEYKAIVDLPEKPKEVASRALLQLAQCQEKLGHGFPGPRNLDFKEGVVGKAPAGWIVPVLPKDVNDFAMLSRTGCRSGGCAVVMAPAHAPRPLSTIMQSFSATPYRGKTVRFRAWLRVEAGNGDDSAQMFLSVDRENHQTGFFDNMDDRPMRSAEWTRCDIVCRIDDDARFIEMGIMSIGRGKVLVDDVSFEVVR
jgi:hypothetical protein